MELEDILYRVEFFLVSASQRWKSAVAHGPKIAQESSIAMKMPYPACFGPIKNVKFFSLRVPYLAVNSSKVSSLSSDPDVLGAEVVKVHAAGARSDWELTA